MTAADRRGPVRRALPALVLIGLLVGLTGCTGLRRAIGLDNVGPDEFAVESRAPLTIPPDFDLRPPQPGAPRPQETPAAEKARKLVDTAGPGEAGKQTTAVLRAPAGGISGTGGGDPAREVAPQSLAAKLLTSGDSPGGGTERRQTTPLEGVH